MTAQEAQVHECLFSHCSFFIYICNQIKFTFINRIESFTKIRDELLHLLILRYDSCVDREGESSTPKNGGMFIMHNEGQVYNSLAF
jgi:hypothetical protein